MERQLLTTIVLSNELNADLVILDEKRARKIANLASIKVMGSIGILEEALEEGIIKD